MDDAIIEVLEQYHARIERENLSFPVAAPGGRNSVNFQSMLAIGPETGQFLNILVHSLTAPRILELGTSFGYSAIWLAEAARATGGHLTTIEIDPERSAHALDMSTQAGLSPLVLTLSIAQTLLALSEATAVLVAIILLSLYYLVLYTQRRHLEGRLVLMVEPVTPHHE